MRPVALGRKKFLFVSSERGGRAAAIYYSLIESCKLNKVNPLSYMTYLLTNARNKTETLLLPTEFEVSNTALLVERSFAESLEMRPCHRAPLSRHYDNRTDGVLQNRTDRLLATSHWAFLHGLFFALPCAKRAWFVPPNLAVKSTAVKSACFLPRIGAAAYF